MSYESMVMTGMAKLLASLPRSDIRLLPLKPSIESIQSLLEPVERLGRSRRQVRPVSLSESRALTPDEILKKRIVSCGTLVTLAAHILRHAHIPCLLVHACHEDGVHALLMYWNVTGSVWQVWDQGEIYAAVPPEYSTYITCSGWSDIVERIKADERQLRDPRFSLVQARRNKDAARSKQIRITPNNLRKH